MSPFTRQHSKFTSDFFCGTLHVHIVDSIAAFCDTGKTIFIPSVGETKVIFMRFALVDDERDTVTRNNQLLIILLLFVHQLIIKYISSSLTFIGLFKC